MDRPFLLPGEIVVIPELLIHGMNRGLGSACRVWALARHIDSNGLGYIRQIDLHDLLNELRVQTRTRRNWIKQAVKVGLLQESSVRDERIYRIVGWPKAASIVGSQWAGAKASMSIQLLVRTGWKAKVFDAFNATLNGRPVSQKTKRHRTGVIERTQRRYEKKGGGTTVANYAVTNLAADMIPGVREHLCGHAFVNKGGQIGWRLPNSRIVPRSVSRPLPSGRRRKVQKMINLSLKKEREPGQFAYRLYHETEKKADYAVRKMGQRKIPKEDRPNFVYGWIRERNGIQEWLVFPVRGDLLP